MTLGVLDRSLAPGPAPAVPRAAALRRLWMPRIGIAGFALAVLGLLAVGQGGLLMLAYPAGALALGVWLYLRYPAHYIGFTWWMYFLSAGVRRVIDSQIGWNEVSTILLAPVLVAALSAFTVLRHLPALYRAPLLPFACVVYGVTYGYLVGLINAGLSPATMDLLNWIVPVLFSVHIALNWRLYPEYRATLYRTFMWAMLATGSYGLYQFFFVPDWDALWMQNVQMNTVGEPEPMMVRVFSTMNSPEPFAGALMAALLLFVSAPSKIRWLAVLPGLAGFLLSAVRAAWTGWAVGMAMLLCFATMRQRLQFAVLCLCALLLALPVLSLEGVEDTVGKRLTSLTNMKSDESFHARLQFYRDFMDVALTNVLGSGMGSTGSSTRLANAGSLGKLGDFDSGIMQVTFVLGWPGAVLYVSGLASLLLACLRGGLTGGEPDAFAQTARAIALGVVIQMVFVNTLTGVGGMVFWTFAGCVVAARSYHAARPDTG